MTKHKDNCLHTIKTNDIVKHVRVFGDGDEQLALFHEIKEYTQDNLFRIGHVSEHIGPGNRMQDTIGVSSDKYDILIVKKHMPTINFLPFAPHYHVQILDKHENKMHNHMGTMAEFMFDMFNNMQKAQK
jgi:hypothetical protein